MDSFDQMLFSRVQELVRKSGGENIIDDSKIREVSDRILKDCKEALFEKLKSDAPRILKKHRRQRDGFCKRLNKKWKKPIDLLELFLLISYEIGAEFNGSNRDEASKNNDFLFDVLTRQHARACQIGFEILALLKSGLADGAFARWRTLYETVVISFLIKEYRLDLPERFLKYEIIESYKQALEYQKHCTRLGYKPLGAKEIQQLESLKTSLLKTYGKDFYKEYGWIPTSILSNPNFAKIEALVKFDHLRPYYKMACFNVHSGPKSIRFKLGLIADSSKSQALLAGPSNYGLADPGQSMAIAMYQITVCLLSTKPNVQHLVTIGVMQRLLDEICPAFVKVQLKIEEEERFDSVRNKGQV